MSRVPRWIRLAVLLLMAASAAPSSAQTTPDAADSAVREGASPAPVQAVGLPPRATPPPTMAAHWPIFLLFAASWIGIVGSLMVAGRRTARIVSRLEAGEGSR